jgi:DNA-binding response OmpR family regulator
MRRDLDTAALPVLASALVVADDLSTVDKASFALRNAGFEVTAAANGAVPLRGLQSNKFDLVILDMMLPDGSGIQLLREIRVNANTPVILLGAGDSEAERVLGLELGADDYVSKPFSPLELASRSRAILRRAQRERFGAPAPAVHAVGVLRIDLPRHEVLLGQRSVEVTASELRVLELLAGSPGTVFTRRQIMEHVWEGPYFGDGHPVDTHVLNLRRKIEDDPTRRQRSGNRGSAEEAASDRARRLQRLRLRQPAAHRHRERLRFRRTDKRPDDRTRDAPRRRPATSGVTSRSGGHAVPLSAVTPHDFHEH